MVQDTPAGQHSAGGDDDHRALAGVQLLGLLDRVYPLGDLEHRNAVFAADVVLGVMTVIDLGRIHRHRAVEEHRDIGNIAALHQSRNVQHQPLCPSDGKGRDQHRAAAGKRAFQDRGQLGLGVGVGMGSVAVGGFADQYIGPAEWLRRSHQRIGIMAQIAAEMDNPAANFKLDLGRPKKMSRRTETGRDAVAQLDPLVKGVRLKAIQRSLCILERVEWFWVLVLGISLSGGIARLFLLDMPAVGQNEPAQFRRCLGAKNPPAISRPDQRGQIPRMVQMGMGEQHSVDGVDAHRERFAIART